MHNVEGERFKVPVHDPGLAAEQIDTLEMKVGDTLIFNNLVFHRSLVNQSEGIRWSTDFRYSAADTSLYDLWHKALAFILRLVASEIQTRLALGNNGRPSGMPASIKIAVCSRPCTGFHGERRIGNRISSSAFNRLAHSSDSRSLEA